MHYKSIVSHSTHLAALPSASRARPYRYESRSVRFSECARPSVGVRGIVIGVAISSILWFLLATAAFANSI